MQTKHLFVLIHIRNKGEVSTIKFYIKPSSKSILPTVPRRCFFCGSFLLFLFCVCHAFSTVHCSLVVTCWERADLLALLYVMFYCIFVTFPCDALGQVWCMIVSIPDFCLLSYFDGSIAESLKLNIFHLKKKNNK